MQNVFDGQVARSSDASELPLAVEIQEVSGELVTAAREGLLALSVGAGLSLISQLMELEVWHLAGTKGKRTELAQ